MRYNRSSTQRKNSADPAFYSSDPEVTSHETGELSEMICTVGDDAGSGWAFARGALAWLSTACPCEAWSHGEPSKPKDWCKTFCFAT